MTLRLNRRQMTAALALGAALSRAGGARAAPAPAKRPWPSSRQTPSLELPGLDGAPVWRLAGARGKVVLLNFWASWCPPCVDEMPSLELLAQRHEADGLEVVAVNFRESGASIRRFVARMAFSLPIVLDADGAAARAWQVGIFPTSVLVGRDGRARFSVVGEADWGAAPARQWVAGAL